MSAPRPLRSLAWRLTLFYAIAIFLTLAVTSGLLYWSLVSRLNREDDDFLGHEVHVLRELLKPWPAGQAELDQEVLSEWQVSPYARLDIRILDQHGRPLLANAGVDRDLPADRFPPIAASGWLKGRDLNAHGHHFRAVTAWASSSPGGPAFILQIALDRTREENALAAYRGDLALALAAFLLLALAAGYGIAHRGVRPVEASFARLSRFSADLAHELRTPVHNLRGEIEVMLAQPRAAAEYRRALESALEESIRLGRLVDGLLFLARAENAQIRPAAENVGVDRELAAIAEFYQPAAEQAGISLQTESASGLVIRADRALFQRAVGNLLENALAHTPAGGKIVVTAARAPDAIRVRVADTGPGVSAAHLERILEPLERAAPSAPATSTGLGLGLSIVRGIMRLHGGTIQLDSQPGSGLAVTLSFPVGAEETSPADANLASASSALRH